MSVTLGAPVVVAEFTAYCDRADHEVTVLTDGRRVTAGTTGLTGVQFTSAVSREDTLFRVTCDRLDRHDEPCGGEVIVDQSDKDCWRAATAADAAWLDSSAQTVDQ